MKVVSVPIGKLQLDSTNARRHSAANLQAIRQSIKRFGQVEPLVVQRSTGRILGGNGRYAVFVEEGVKQVKVNYVDVEGVQADALAIALNRTGELATWDEGQLSSLLAKIDDQSTELLGELGFDEDELRKLISSADVDLEDFTKPNLDDMVPEDLSTKPEGDKHWFYVEFYGAPERFEALTEMLGADSLRTKHEIKSEAFEAIIEAWYDKQEKK